MTYRILDLFCGAGGAAMGYHRAGFNVVGVDIADQPRYPFKCWEGFDALDFVRTLIDRMRYGGALPYRLSDFDAIHASPPCQDWSVTKHIRGGKTNYPRLIAPVRELLFETGLPFVIENVELARKDMRDPVKLCGSMFGNLGKWNGDVVYLQRHRMFETNFPLAQPKCDHSVGVRAVTVAGHGRPDVDPARGAYFAGRGYMQLCRDVMGIDWMNRDELNESIPPTYAEYVGRHLTKHLDSTSNREGRSRVHGWKVTVA